jgi:hypothetical protein
MPIEKKKNLKANSTLFVEKSSIRIYFDNPEEN